MELFALLITATILITTIAIRKLGNARSLAIARKLGLAWVTIIVFMLVATASASDLEVIIKVVIDDDEDEPQLYEENGNQIDGTLTVHSGGEPRMLVFRDFQDPSGDRWKLGVIYTEPTAAVACRRRSDAVECLYNGSTDVELWLEATSQQQPTVKKRKPLVIVPGPQSQPAVAPAA